MQAKNNSALMHSEACERNKAPILDVLRQYLPSAGAVLEIGSGTGQHVVYFADQFPELIWQPCDTGDYLPALRARLQHEAPTNVCAAIALDVRVQPWMVQSYAAVYSANTLHFMGTDCVEQFFAGVAAALDAEGHLLVYGPFRYGGEFTSPSNAQFDRRLKAGDPVRGIRDVEWLNELAAQHGFELAADVSMPAHNQLLVWQMR